MSRTVRLVLQNYRGCSGIMQNTRVFRRTGEVLDEGVQLRRPTTCRLRTPRQRIELFELQEIFLDQLTR